MIMVTWKYTCDTQVYVHTFMIDWETNLKVFIAADFLNIFPGEKENLDFYIKIQNWIS